MPGSCYRGWAYRDQPGDAEPGSFPLADGPPGRGCRPERRIGAGEAAGAGAAATAEDVSALATEAMVMLKGSRARCSLS